MKAITCLIGLFLLFLASPAKAQSDGDEIPWSINSGTMVGIGSYNLMDTYLSPSMEDKKYTGPGFRGLYRLYVGLPLSFAHGIAGFKASGGWCRAWHGWFYIQYPQRK